VEIAAKTLIFDDGDRKRFVETLGEAAVRANWQVHAFCLMRNHFHLVIETHSRRWFGVCNGC
jgi:REP-associated tyrosine transposase